MGIDVESFIRDGYVRIPGAVPQTLARAIGEQAALLVGDGAGASWRLGLASVYDVPVLVEALTPVVRAASDALIGTGRWHLAAIWGFPTRFPGASDTLWHVDGDWFTHHVTSGEQVLTPIFLWDDVGIDDSPTLLAVGSHLGVARLLADHEPEGVAGTHIGQVVDSTVARDEVAAATGEAGDLIVCHPFLAHSVNPAGPTRPRFISNVAVHGKQPLAIGPTRETSSPVESAIRQALGQH
jgi:hypothetical protein